MARLRASMVSLFSLIVTSCASLPAYRDPPPTTADVISHLTCEIRDAAWNYPEHAWIRDWTVGLIFKLEVNHVGGINSDANTWTFPLNHGATFSVAVAGGFSGEATRTEIINFKIPMSQVKSKAIHCERGEPSRYAMLGGRLGIKDLFDRAGYTMTAARVPTQRFVSLSYNLEFIVKANAGVTPKFSVIPIGKEKTFSGSAAWSGSRKDTQRVEITLTPPAEKHEELCSVSAPQRTDKTTWPDPTKCPSPVYVVEAQAACWTLTDPKHPNDPGLCSARTDCTWDPKKHRCGVLNPSGDPTSLARQRMAPSRAATGLSKSDEDRNSNAQLLNAIQSLKIGN